MDAETQAPLATYTLQLFGPDRILLTAADWPAWRGWLLEAEQNLTDLLPEGYSVRIKEWDDEHD